MTHFPVTFEINQEVETSNIRVIIRNVSHGQQISVKLSNKLIRKSIF